MKPHDERRTLTVYLASPLGFTEPGRSYNKSVLIPAVTNVGFQVFDPWAATPSDELDGHTIGENNRVGIDNADAVLCWLEGQELDAGTCAELGYAVGTGKFVVGVRADLRLSGEGFGPVNLQVEYFVAQSGGSIVASLDEAVSALDEWRARYLS